MKRQRIGGGRGDGVETESERLGGHGGDDIVFQEESVGDGEFHDIFVNESIAIGAQAEHAGDKVAAGLDGTQIGRQIALNGFIPDSGLGGEAAGQEHGSESDDKKFGAWHKAGAAGKPALKLLNANTESRQSGDASG